MEVAFGTPVSLCLWTFVDVVVREEWKKRKKLEQRNSVPAAAAMEMKHIYKLLNFLMFIIRFLKKM